MKFKALLSFCSSCNKSKEIMNPPEGIKKILTFYIVDILPK